MFKECECVLKLPCKAWCFLPPRCRANAVHLQQLSFYLISIFTHPPGKRSYKKLREASLLREDMCLSFSDKLARMYLSRVQEPKGIAHKLERKEESDLKPFEEMLTLVCCFLFMVLCLDVFPLKSYKCLGSWRKKILMDKITWIDLPGGPEAHARVPTGGFRKFEIHSQLWIYQINNL